MTISQWCLNGKDQIKVKCDKKQKHSFNCKLSRFAVANFHFASDKTNTSLSIEQYEAEEWLGAIHFRELFSPGVVREHLLDIKQRQEQMFKAENMQVPCVLCSKMFQKHAMVAAVIFFLTPALLHKLQGRRNCLWVQFVLIGKISKRVAVPVSWVSVMSFAFGSFVSCAALWKSWNMHLEWNVFRTGN